MNTFLIVIFFLKLILQTLKVTKVDYDSCIFKNYNFKKLYVSSIKFINCNLK